MTLKALVYAYVIGGFTFIPLVLVVMIAWAIYSSIPVGDLHPNKPAKARLWAQNSEGGESQAGANDQSKPRKGWLTVRRTFEEKEFDGSYVNLMRSFLDARSKDPKRSRPKDMWYVVLKGNVLYLYEDEAMTECEAAIQVSSHKVTIHPDGLLDGELFTKRNAICLKPLSPPLHKEMHSVTKEMELENKHLPKETEEIIGAKKKKQKEKEVVLDDEQEEAEKKEAAREEAFSTATPWFIFVRSCVEMEDWYFALVHASCYPATTPTLDPLLPIFQPADMLHLVSTLDEQPDIIPMRWLNALLGRLFFSYYRTQSLESYLIGRLMKKLSRVKTPSFLQNIIVTEVSVGNTAPTLSKPMLKELTKEGDAALEVHVMYKGEVRITIEATALISLGQRFKTYTVKLVLAAVLRELEGNLLIKVKRPPSNRIWYAFTQPPSMVLDVEPVVSDRQIKWGMILSTMESRLKEIIYESIVMPNMDDIAFFSSSQYQHRGGIWADARSKVYSTTDIPSHPEDPVGVPSNEASPLPKSHSTDVVTETRKSDPLGTLPIRRAETIVVPEVSSSPIPKRNAWFSGNRSDVNDGLNLSSEGQFEQQRASTSRERAVSQTSSSSRATSALYDSNESAKNLELSEDLLSGDTAHEAVELSSAGLAPSSHHHSSTLPSKQLSSSHSPSPSSPNFHVPNTRDSSSSNITSRVSDHSATSKAATNATSFLSALKSKAADKQALSNSAKEAMRKLSANWNAFKRETSGNSNGLDVTLSGGSSDHGIPSSFSATGSVNMNSNVFVAGKKEEVGMTPSIHQNGQGSPPIDIPKRAAEEVDNRSRSMSPPTSSNNGAASPSSADFSVSQHQKPTLLRGDTPKVSPSSPRLTTEILGSDTRSHSSGDAAHAPNTPLDPPAPPAAQAAPIHVQPSQAATMTIPGIHARHRGEVMSLGYAPPFTPLATESKVRSPAIQSVYKLFKTPSLGEQQQSQQRSLSQAQEQFQSSDDSVHTTGKSAQSDVNTDVARLSIPPSDADHISSESQSSLKAAPPPLPPRSTPTTASFDTLTSSSSSAMSSASSSASEALKIIASQDESKRQSLESAPLKKSPSNKRASLGARRVSGHTFDDILADSVEQRERDDFHSLLRDASAALEMSSPDNGVTNPSQVQRTPVLPPKPALPPRKSQTPTA